ncbi:MobA/MobL family protein [Ancylobacter sonchi]|uniref:MobQ family relaxase n=1 Tax=Ancylobacter sonchi TaxID=1937790 RepID=UPI001BD1F1F8|nr:MobQ family relaxase [Ancylobacter sonchi]MBS7532330.1 MobA/MobL family protein [Ancylobacter sonchi]
MALMSTRIQIISRKTKSAVGAAAYRAAAVLFGIDGTRHDYTRKGHVEHAEILAPDGTPEWAFNRERLWQKVDEVEKRKDAQLAREFRVMLPAEFTQEQRIEVARAFVKKHFVDRGMIADICWHNPPTRDGHGMNPHFHVMLPLRPIVNGAFGNKTVGARIHKKTEDGAAKFRPTTDWNDQAKWQEAREDWARTANIVLERNGEKSRIDHRSFEERGLKQSPQPYLGVAPHVDASVARAKLAGRVKELNERLRQRVNQWVAHRISGRAWTYAKKVIDGEFARSEGKINNAAPILNAVGRFTDWLEDTTARMRKPPPLLPQERFVGPPMPPRDKGDIDR